MTGRYITCRELFYRSFSLLSDASIENNIESDLFKIKIVKKIEEQNLFTYSFEGWILQCIRCVRGLGGGQLSVALLSVRDGACKRLSDWGTSSHIDFRDSYYKPILKCKIQYQDLNDK